MWQVWGGSEATSTFPSTPVGSCRFLPSTFLPFMLYWGNLITVRPSNLAVGRNDPGTSREVQVLAQKPAFIVVGPRSSFSQHSPVWSVRLGLDSPVPLYLGWPCLLRLGVSRGRGCFWLCHLKLTAFPEQAPRPPSGSLELSSFLLIIEQSGMTEVPLRSPRIT